MVYCRVSTKGQEQDGTSLDSQETACCAHAKKLGYSVGRVTREVYSGAELYDRPKLSQDRADIRAGKFQALIVYALDRLSRDPIHVEILAEECVRAGCELIFVSGPLDDSPEGQLIRFVGGYAARQEREKIRERQLRGKHTRALQGKLWNYGTSLYGFHRDKALGIRIIYEPEARVVRLIFHWAAEEGLGIRTIAQRLNDQGIPSPAVGKLTYPDPDRKPRWGRNQVLRVLHHPAYKGETYAWRTRRPTKPEDRRRPDFNSADQVIVRPQSEWIKLPDGTTPTLISPELWQRAQDTLKNNRGAATRNAKVPYLLRGMVFCGVCGQAMYSNIENSGTNHAHRVYRCSSRDKAGGACGGGRIPAELVEQWTWECVSSTLKNPAVLAEEVEHRRDDGPDPALANDLETAKRELAKREQKQAELLQKFSASDDSSFPWALVEREIKRLDDEKPYWQKTITDIEERLASYQMAVGYLEALQRYCEQASYRIDAFGFEEKRLALKALDIKVTGNGRDWDIQGRIPIEQGAVSHNLSKLWLPLAATSSARLTCSCPRTSARS